MAANRWIDTGRNLLDSVYAGSLETVAQIHAAIARIMEAGQSTLSGIASLLAKGARTLKAWASDTMAALVPVYYGATLAKIPDPTPDDLRQLQILIAAQGRYLSQFREEIRDGRIPLLDPETGAVAPGFLHRVGLYPLAAWSIALGVDRFHHVMAGYHHERRLLGGTAHCRQCKDEAKKGWSRIGSLLPIGKTVCRNHCRCRYIFA